MAFQQKRMQPLAAVGPNEKLLLYVVFLQLHGLCVCLCVFVCVCVCDECGCMHVSCRNGSEMRRILSSRNCVKFSRT